MLIKILQSTLTLLLILILPFGSQAQEGERIPPGTKEAVHAFIKADGGKIDQTRVEPPFWWTGMENPNLEILIYDQDIQKYGEIKIKHPGIKVLEVHRPQNPNYLFVELLIGSGTKAGKFEIELSQDQQVKTYSYELKKRAAHPQGMQGLGPEDLIYLLMPDRFANGDPSNDDLPAMRQNGLDRDNVFYRHGGDLQGVIDHLDYLKELGITALWMNPFLENDQSYDSYHGYAITDHYKVDPRFGSNELYQKLVKECHQRGIKVIMDIIHNHVGDEHWFIRDLPSEDWIHQFEAFTKTTYRAPTLMDPYAAKADQTKMSDGWFDNHMPDLNQKNPHLAKYLIQNHLWWIEYTGQDGYRIDTYAYPDQEFAADWGEAMQKQYPGIGLFAETWVHGSPIQAQFTQDNYLRKDYNSHMPAVTDYQLHYAINEALNRKQGWTEGLARIYYTLAKDFLYKDPFKNVIFLDNHDLPRFYGTVEKDWNKYCSGISFLLTTRGVPMIYYGTEILMEGAGGAFGEGGRLDFPGGWPGDPANKFSKEGRTDLEEQAFQFVKKLANYRRQTPALQTGKLMQFVPENDSYVYFRYDAAKTVMVLMNSSDKAQSLSLDRYQERLLGFSQARDVISEKVHALQSPIVLEPHATLVLECF